MFVVYKNNEFIYGTNKLALQSEKPGLVLFFHLQDPWMDGLMDYYCECSG